MKFCSNLKGNIDNIETICSIFDEDEFLKSISQQYIDTLNINEENIISIRVINDFELDKNILNSSRDRVVVCNSDEYLVEIVTESDKEVSIKPKSVIINTNEMYIGSHKIEEGQVGVKSVTMRNTYINGKENKDLIVREKVIRPVRDTIIYVGCKNPIEDNIAFLNHPTGGGIVTSQFGERWGDFHTGMDIGKSVGESVEAATDGVVKEAGYNQFGYGNLIVLEHGLGIETYYAHLDTINIKLGDKVSKGDIIGTVGNTGISTGPHLHFELRVNGNAINPQEYIN